jgi:hypothetical protein
LGNLRYLGLKINKNLWKMENLKEGVNDLENIKREVW